MDLQVTTQMLTSRNIKVLHLEPTDVCQAACPLCARETDKNFDKGHRHQLSVEQLESILPEELVVNLDKMFMCGNYGDPAAGNHTIAIYEWFRQQNPNIVLGMNTNGAIGTTFWWHSLAKSAHWDMLVYKHNQHQVNACEQLARDMGFKWFRAKVSKRPLIGKLESPVGWINPKQQAKSISCHALNEQSIFIDACGRVSPCCWLGSRQRDFVTDFEAIKSSWVGLQPNIVCMDACGTEDVKTSFDNQWQRELALN